MNKLFIDLVPKTAWFSNLRSELSKEEWKDIQTKTFKAAGYRCEICQGRGDKHWVECHERWEYNIDTKTQKLLGTIALCPKCHQATHYGLAQIKGFGKQARSHLMKINNWSEKEVDQHINEAFKNFQERNKIQWRLDALWLIDFVPISEKSIQILKDHAEERIKR